jgi:hypothetical protein
MTPPSSTTVPVWVAIDVAKAFHQVLIELPGGQRRAMRVANSTTDVARLVTYLPPPMNAAEFDAGALVVQRLEFWVNVWRPLELDQDTLWCRAFGGTPGSNLLHSTCEAFGELHRVLHAICWAVERFRSSRAT